MQRFRLMGFRTITRFIAAAIVERRTAINLPASAHAFIKHNRTMTGFDQHFSRANACGTSAHNHRIEKRTHANGSVKKDMPSSSSVVQARTRPPSLVMTWQS